jgi:hypothetical protein
MRAACGERENAGTEKSVGALPPVAGRNECMKLTKGNSWFLAGWDAILKLGVVHQLWRRPFATYAGR